MTHWKLYYHLVWSTKNREPTIDARREQRIRDSIRLTCSEMSVVQYELGIMPDHVHMFVALPPTIAVSLFVRHIKGDSSRYMNARDRSTTFRWQREFGAYSIHENQIPRLLEYIRNQAEHHASNQLHANLEITERQH
ncbi:MAG: IS200/IS605 family transposase [Thermomicrobiales bacterium]|nr:IS200/IS605 family transposase [Thermomicrobiales bacterium]